MIKIGEFAKLGCVTVKTLRHYDRLGLLRPSWVDRYSGYRYYELDQLKVLNQIMTFKSMGFSLEQIKDMRAEDTPGQLRQLLCEQRQALNAEMEAIQERVEQIGFSLQQLETPAAGLEIVPRIKAVDARGILYLPLDPADDSPLQHKQIDGFRQRVNECLRNPTLLDPKVAWLLLSDLREEDEENRMAIGFLLEEQALRKARGAITRCEQVNFRYRHLDADESVLSILFNLRQMPPHDARLAVYEWAQRNTYQLEGPQLEIHYAIDPFTPNSEETLVEVQIPVRKKGQTDSVGQVVRKEETGQMETKVVTKQACMVIGSSDIFTMQDADAGKIGKFWEAFNPRYQEIKSLVIAEPEMPAYGVCGPMLDEERFRYMVGFELKDEVVKDIPDGMEVQLLPEQLYVVVTAVGAAKEIGAAYRYAFETWLPQSDYAHDQGKPDFEYYNHEFNDFKEDSKVYVYIPIKKK
ncbi:MAG: MerR family transcriptional regulator [Anaerolineaceae bacterium]|nr:MerR family transcriptional regulator [Anaerolineaceae bacterium]